MIYLELLWVFGKIGAVTFGGGYAMISLFLQEVVSRGWVTPEDFANIVAVAQMTPGPIAMNTATYVGKMTGGLPGAVIASFALVLPPLLYITLMLKLSAAAEKSRWLRPYIRGIRAAAIGLIGTAVLFFAENSLVTSSLPPQGTWKTLDFRLPGVGIFLLVVFLQKKAQWGVIPSILISAALGVLLLWFFPG